MTASRTRQFACGACAGKLEFAPGKTALKCPHCGHLEAIAEHSGIISELDFHSALREQASAGET